LVPRTVARLDAERLIGGEHGLIEFVVRVECRVVEDELLPAGCCRKHRRRSCAMLDLRDEPVVLDVPTSKYKCEGNDKQDANCQRQNLDGVIA
jgi:hypothetical protein